MTFRMTFVRILASLLALLIGGWLLYDGVRAMTKGDYTTPSSGPHANQLGPWAAVVRRVGLDPRGTVVKSAHVALGALWCLGALALLARLRLASPLLVICAVGTLWYLPAGTLIGVIELGLLLWLRRRGAV